MHSDPISWKTFGKLNEPFYFLKGRFFNLDVEIDGSKKLQIAPLKFVW